MKKARLASLIVSAIAACTALSASATTWYWTGAGGDLNWFTAANWSDGEGNAATDETPLASGDSFTFDAFTPSGDVNYNPEGDFNIATITFGAGLTGTVKITGGKITSLGNAVNNNATYAMEFANEIQFASTINLTVPTKHILLSGGARGTLPANHNKLYGKYTLTSGWTVTANYTIANGSHVTVPSITESRSFESKISTEANSLLEVNGNFTSDQNVSGKAAYGLGTHNGELRVFGTFKVRNRHGNGLYFVIGRDPVTELYRGQVALDDRGYVIADESAKTNIPGVFAAGDLRTKALRQVVTAAADGAVAIAMAEEYLAENR